MHGGDGNDLYIVDNSSDSITEGSSSGSGTDTVHSSAHFTLPNNVENLRLTGSANLIGKGNSSNNILIEIAELIPYMDMKETIFLMAVQVLILQYLVIKITI